MADTDIASSLPVRSEADSNDARVQVKIVDRTAPGTQQMDVDTDHNAHVEVHGNGAAAGTDRTLRMSELGSASVDGVYDGTNNTDPSQIGLVGLSHSASPLDSQQTLRITGVTNAAGDVRALDVALRDEAGEPFSNTNPIPVSISESDGGTPLQDEKTALSIAKNGTDNHTISVANNKTFELHQILAAASGKMKMELLIGNGAVSEVFTRKAMRYNSTANPQCDANFDVPIAVAGTINTTTVKVVLTNWDNQPQDMTSTIVGSTY